MAFLGSLSKPHLRDIRLRAMCQLEVPDPDTVVELCRMAEDAVKLEAEDDACADCESHEEQIESLEDVLDRARCLTTHTAGHCNACEGDSCEPSCPYRSLRVAIASYEEEFE